MKNKVSIIVPVYNVKNYLVECLESLVNQSLKDIEIILINDGSTDGGNLILEDYAQKYSNIKYISQINQGQSVARNNGLKVASGEYVLFVDSDDYIVPNAVEVLYSVATKLNADIVVGDMLNELEHINSNPDFRKIGSEDKSINVIDFAKLALTNNAYDIVPWIRLVKKSYLEDNGISFLEGCYYEDQEYSLKLYTQYCGRAVKIRFPFYYYRMQRAGSTTTYTTLKKSEDFLKVIDSMHQYISTLDGDNCSVAIKILGISYYHFVQVWLKQQPKYQKIVRERFLKLLNSFNLYTQAIDGLKDNLKKTVRAMIYNPKKLKIKYRFKGFLRKVKSIIKR